MYQYYQPNRKDLKDKYGDCTVRALSKALGVSWLEAFEIMIPFCKTYQCTNIFDMPRPLVNQVMRQLGFEYHGISNARGSSRPTVACFARTHRDGVYIVNVAHHVVAVKGGDYFDTWDSGCKFLYGYYELVD